MLTAAAASKHGQALAILAVSTSTNLHSPPQSLQSVLSRTSVITHACFETSQCAIASLVTLSPPQWLHIIFFIIISFQESAALLAAWFGLC